MSAFDGLPEIFTNADFGFGEAVAYTPAATGIPATISAIWIARPLTVTLGQVGEDATDVMLHVRAADVPAPQEGDTVRRVATGETMQVATPIEADGNGMIAIRLATTE